MSEFTLDQFQKAAGSAKPKETPGEEKSYSLEEFKNISKGKDPKALSDAETLKAAHLEAMRDVPKDFKENSMTAAIVGQINRFFGKEILKTQLQAIASGQTGKISGKPTGEEVEDARLRLRQMEEQESVERFAEGRRLQHKAAKKEPGLKETLLKSGGELVGQVKERPMTTMYIMGKSLFYDWGIFRLTGLAEIPAQVARITETVTKAKSAAAAAKVTTAFGEGFVVGAGGSAAEQKEKKGEVDVKEATASGLMFAGGDVAARVLGGLIPKRKEVERPTGAKKEPAPLEPEFTPEEHRQARKVIEDEHDWGIYNAAVKDHEAVKAAEPEMKESLQASKKATEELAEPFHAEIEGPPKDWVTDAEFKDLMAKPAFQRSAEDLVKIKRWGVQGLMAAGVGGMGIAYALADDENKKNVVEAGLLTGFFLKSPRVAEGLKRAKGTGREWAAELDAAAKKNRGMAEELKWHDGMKILRTYGEDSFTRDEVTQLLRDAPYLHMEETILGGELGVPELTALERDYYRQLEKKHGKDWQEKIEKLSDKEKENIRKLRMASPDKPTVYGAEESLNTPGTTRRRELLIKLPRSIAESPEALSHWASEGANLAVHVRGGEILSVDGKRFFHIDEIQSDTAARLRKVERVLEEARAELSDLESGKPIKQRGRDTVPEISAARRKMEIERVKSEIEGIEKERDSWERLLKSSPFVGKTEDWTSLGLRRVLRYAMDKGFDGVTLVSPEAMVERTGKEWPKKYYGETVPKTFGDVVKTLGGKVEDVEFKRTVPADEAGPRHLHELEEQHPGYDYVEGEWQTAPDITISDKFQGVRFTPEMRAKINEGFSLFDRQGGKMHTELMALVAGAGIGALIGGNTNKDSPIMAAAIGAALGALGGRVAERAITHSWTKTVPELISGEKAKRQRVEGVVDDHQHLILAAQRQAMQMQNILAEASPVAARRETLTKAIDGAAPNELFSKVEREALVKTQAYLDTLTRVAQKVGIHEDVRRLFLKQQFDRFGNDPRALAQYIKDVEAGTENFTFVAGGQRRGLSPVSPDLMAVVGMYTSAVARAVANRRVIDVLSREGRVPDGNGAMLPLMMSATEKGVPAGYIPIDRPMLHGKRVHPDIKPELDMLFDTKDPDAWIRAASAISTASKRAKVSLSLFHATALTQAMIGSSGSLKIGAVGAVAGAGVAAAMGKDPTTGAEFGFAAGVAAPVLMKIPGFVRGSDAMLKQIREGGAGDIVDQASRAGLKFSLERHAPVVGDINQDFRQGMQSLQNFADKFVHPLAGKAVEKVEKGNHAVDNFMWGRLHAGMKLNVWAKTRDKLLKDNAAARDRSPDVPILTKERAGKIAASYTNSLFGGLNWVKLMEGVQSRFGRQFASDLMGPTGQRYMGMLMFAPDWTISTTLSAVRALDIRPSQMELGNLHRMYMLRAALWTVGLGEALNYTMSGHHLWENKDMTVVDLGDGWTMQLSKHFYEPFHWLQKPGQQALNKLAVIPAESAKQLSGSKWLSTKGAPKMTPKERVKSVMSQFAPFSATSGMDEQGLTRGLSGAVGLPIYPPRGKKKKRAEDYLSDAEKE